MAEREKAMQPRVSRRSRQLRRLKLSTTPLLRYQGHSWVTGAEGEVQVSLRRPFLTLEA